MTLPTNILSDDICIFPDYAGKILPTLASDNINDGSISYQFNEHGYRSLSFTKKSSFNILTLGCSWTMGIGVQEQQSWPSLVSNRFQNATVFNYGMYGVSVSFIAKNFYKILCSGMIPNVCLIMWPGFSRRDYINKEGQFRKIGGFRKAHATDPVWKNHPEDLMYLELQNDYQDIMKFWEAYKFVEVTSKLYNVPVFHTVAGYYYEIFKQNDDLIKNFIDNSTFFRPFSCYKNDKKGRDKQHPGPMWHQKFANNFLTFIEDYNETKKIFTNIK
jgi:hypothetical protein